MNTVTDTLYCSGSACNYGSYADVKDNGSASIGVGPFNIGGSWADNSTVCDSQGNCIVRDNLWFDNNQHSASNIDHSSVSVRDNLWLDNNSKSANNIDHSRVSIRDNLWFNNNQHSASNIRDSSVSVRDNLKFYAILADVDHISPPAPVAPVAPHGQGVPGVKGVAGVPDVRLMDALYQKAGGHHNRGCGEPNYADNATVCDSRGNCMVKDALYKKGPCVPAGLPNGANMGIPAGLPNGANMGIPAGLPKGANMGIPAGLPNGANMGIPTGLPNGAKMGNMQRKFGY